MVKKRSSNRESFKEVTRRINNVSGGMSQLSPRLNSESQKSSIPNSNSAFFYKKSSESQNGDMDSESVNLEYLKHVILKFITSREYEVRYYLNRLYIPVILYLFKIMAQL